jgi:hypothetical protein
MAIASRRPLQFSLRQIERMWPRTRGVLVASFDVTLSLSKGQDDMSAVAQRGLGRRQRLTLA